MEGERPDAAHGLLADLPGMAYRSEAVAGRRLLQASPGAEALTGLSIHALVGRPLDALVHPEDLRRVSGRVAAAVETARPVDLEYRIRRPDGTDVVVHDRLAPVAGSGGRVREVAGFLAEASPYATGQAWFGRVHECIVQLAGEPSLSTGDVEAFAQSVTRAAAEHLGVSRSGVWLLSEDRSELRLASLYEGESGTHAEGAVIHARDFPVYFASLARQRAIAAEDAATDPRTAEFADTYLRQYDIRSMLDSTIRLAGSVVGVLCNEQVGSPRHWEMHEISFAGELADQVAQAIANRQRREAERDAVLAEHRSAAKSRFLATMSHEIRTPMNGVVGMARMLEETELTDEQGELVRTIRESGDLLLGIINDILDFARIEADRMVVALGPCHVRDLVGRTLRILNGSARERDLELGATVDEDVPDTCIADEGRLEQILVNLLGNAIKFTERGSVRLHVQVERDEAPPQLAFRVRDTGMGIEAQRIQGLFEPFEQGSRPAQAGTAGTGLGLAISRRLAVLMGGSLTATSEPGRGSEFVLTIPLAVPSRSPSPREARVGSTSAEDADLRDLRVLVVEDNAVNLKVVGAMLRHLGIVPCTCENGREALDILEGETERFDVILMDCEMPVLDGYEAARRIRQSAGRHRDTRIVALTAHALPEFRDLARQAGMDDYLTKPLRLDALRAALVEAAARRAS